MGDDCPNCGGQLVDYRTDRQSTGGREVLLNWTICTSCRHVGLRTWMIAHAENQHVRPPHAARREDFSPPQRSRAR